MRKLFLFLFLFYLICVVFTYSMVMGYFNYIYRYERAEIAYLNGDNSGCTEDKVIAGAVALFSPISTAIALSYTNFAEHGLAFNCELIEND